MRQTFVADNVRQCECINYARPYKPHANKAILIFQQRT